VFSPVDPHVLFTACDNCHIHIYDAKEKSLIGAMSGWVLSIDVSPDGLAVALGHEHEDLGADHEQPCILTRSGPWPSGRQVVRESGQGV